MKHLNLKNLKVLNLGKHIFNKAVLNLANGFKYLKNTIF